MCLMYLVHEPDMKLNRQRAMNLTDDRYNLAILDRRVYDWTSPFNSLKYFDEVLKYLC